MRKFIFVTGGVMSGLGKGVVTASTAKLIQLMGYNVSCAKIDPYLNVDAGTMNPYVHGEVFVTEDGGECDMDIGTYERFLGLDLSKEANITTGQVYLSVIEGERRGEYLGKCVQIIPHITDEVKRRIRELASRTGAEVLLVECGGTVGDIEGLPYLESFRQLRLEEGAKNTLFVHVTLAPEAGGEQKTKPTQHSVQELRRIGIQPDVIIVRSKSYLSREAKAKISLFTNVEQEAVISSPDLPSVYLLPKVLAEEGLHRVISRKLELEERPLAWGEWQRLMEACLRPQGEVRIALVGKYAATRDTYVSVLHALEHAGLHYGLKVQVDLLPSERFEEGAAAGLLEGHDAVVVPGGFDRRGSEGIIRAAQRALSEGLPYLGLCFGFQLGLVAIARSYLGLTEANSTELDPKTPHPVIDLLPEQRGVERMGGSMRLGAHVVRILEGTLAHAIYGSTTIRRRHRHRYEVNLSYREAFERAGVVFSGLSEDGRRVEIAELRGRPFLATQFHPEFSSKALSPEPAYLWLVREAWRRRTGQVLPLTAPSLAR
ncbi:MAG: CTP synthetase [Nitrososphaerota archaeon]